MLNVEVLCYLARLITIEFYLRNHIGGFSKILAPANVGACQKILDQADSDVVTPELERGTEKEEKKSLMKMLFTGNFKSNIWHPDRILIRRSAQLNRTKQCMPVLTWSVS